MKRYYCFLEKFNNYFNRKIIIYSTLSDYESNSDDVFIPVDIHSAMLPFDFNPNDNVTTEIIANDVPFEPDYFLLLDEDSNIIQRWFVMEQKRNRQGQWVYSLKRDVIADNFDTLLNAPMFIHRAHLEDSDPFILNNEGMNFNQIKTSETLLKDKSNSAWVVAYVAKNDGGTDVNIDIDSQDLDVPYKTLGQLAAELGTTDAVLADLLNFEGERTAPAYISLDVGISYAVKVADAGRGPSRLLRIRNDVVSQETYGRTSGADFLFYISNANNLSVRLAEMANEMKTLLQTNLSFFYTDFRSLFSRTYFFNENALQKMKSYQGVPIRYLGSYYYLNIAEAKTETKTERNIPYGLYASLKLIADTTVSDLTYASIVSSNPKYNRIYEKHKTVYLEMTKVTDSSLTEQLKTQISTSRYQTEDQEYDIVAFPANDVTVIDTDGTSILSSGTNARRLGSAIALKGDAVCYDVQLLPYCPIPDIISNLGQLDLRLLSGPEHEAFDYVKTVARNGSNLSYTYVNDGLEWERVSSFDPYVYKKTVYLDLPKNSTVTINSSTISGDDASRIGSFTVTANGRELTIQIVGANLGDDDINEADFTISINYDYSSAAEKVGVMVYVQKSSFKTQINLSLTLAESMKIDSNCDLYRLCSPNYQGAFEFNVARNGGSVNFFTVYCTYKPYTPFIKVCPDLSYMYGADFNDNRGLICAGDYSLPRTTSNWQSFQLNNKNYQNIFNRDIQHLDFEHSMAYKEQGITGGLKVLTDTMKGAAGGFVASGGVGAGAVIGGAISGIGSAVGLAADMQIMKQRQREERQYAIDKYNYNLGNIKALPYTLTKVGSFDIASKIFPFLEYYTCTEEEKEALRNKIIYEGMIVMRIGTLNNYYIEGDPKYFKAELIRNVEIADDPHILDAIYDEFMKGVYI